MMDLILSGWAPTENRTTIAPERDPHVGTPENLPEAFRAMRPALLGPFVTEERQFRIAFVLVGVGLLTGSRA